MAKGERQLHTVIFRLTDLAKRQKLGLIDTGVRFNDRAQSLDIFLVIIHGRNNDLTNGNRDLFFASLVYLISRSTRSVSARSA